MDNDAPCAPPSGIYKSYWFPLKKFISPVKSQGSRGVCWSFAAVAAVESRERVQNDNAIDLSEQFLIYKLKFDWDPSFLVEGGSSERTLNAGVDHDQGLIAEAAWTYNPAANRPVNAFDAGVEGTLFSYLDACKNYNGWCSESAPQSPVVCATVNTVQVRAWETIPVGATVPASRARLRRRFPDSGRCQAGSADRRVAVFITFVGRAGACSTPCWSRRFRGPVFSVSNRNS